MNKKDKDGKKSSERELVEIKSGGNEEITPLPEQEKAGEKKVPAPTEKLQAQLEEKTRESAEYFDKWLRLQAEFENFKKRMQKERADLIKFGNESLLKALLPVLDNLDRAIKHGKAVGESSPLLEGVELVQRDFKTMLERFGVKPVQAVGEAFDPEKHEAVFHQESDLEADRVMSTVQDGYFYQDRLLRPAKVIVSKGKVEASKDSAE